MGDPQPNSNSCYKSRVRAVVLRIRPAQVEGGGGRGRGLGRLRPPLPFQMVSVPQLNSKVMLLRIVARDVEVHSRELP